MLVPTVEGRKLVTERQKTQEKIVDLRRETAVLLSRWETTLQLFIETRRERFTTEEVLDGGFWRELLKMPNPFGKYFYLDEIFYRKVDMLANGRIIVLPLSSGELDTLLTNQEFVERLARVPPG